MMDILVQMILWLIIDQTTGISYHRPKFSLCVTWNSSAATFANSMTIGTNPFDVYIDINDTIYVTATDLSRVLVWLNGQVAPVRNINRGLSSPKSVFATVNGDVYIDNGLVHGRVDKWMTNGTSSAIPMNVNAYCYGLFIDNNDDLYCSIAVNHSVIKRSLNNSLGSFAAIVGTGVAGSSSSQFNEPRGIFVDDIFDMYVADFSNDRVQRFLAGSRNGRTVAGSAAPGTITLNGPTAVMLDADGYLFIADFYNNRIVRSGTEGFKCLFGCTSSTGSASNQLSLPHNFAFDSSGNIFVADLNNNRVQMFRLMTNSCVPSYNTPTFCSTATWDPNATTVANSSQISAFAQDLFVDLQNNVYLADNMSNSVRIWSTGSTTLSRTITGNLSSPSSVFVTLNGDVYVDNGAFHHRVDRWRPNASNSTVAMYVNESCFSLFIDVDDSLYCSMSGRCLVVKQTLDHKMNVSHIVAGTGTPGIASNELNSPYGIFVDLNFTLYVADCGNNRIQRFESGQLNGTTVIVNGSSGAINLTCPTKVVMDADGYLFIADKFNHRILGSGPAGFRCIVGCVGGSGSGLDQLNEPWGLSFDTDGNLFVIDTLNRRIQKFFLATNSCDLAVISTSVHETSTTQTKSISSLTTGSTLNAVSSGNGSQLPSPFVPVTCRSAGYIGTVCNISSTACDLLKPCQNNGTCINSSTVLSGYICACLPDYSGSTCQYYNRPCQVSTCLNKGLCKETSNVTFVCQCQPGWESVRCETMINICANITCQNRGVCRPMLLDYNCECLSQSYSGQFCENVLQKTIALQAASKSFASVAITAMVCIALFVMVMDVLKYGFGIDPVTSVRRSFRAKKRPKKNELMAMIRFHQVATPPPLFRS